MDKEIITFGDIEIEKQKFHYHKNLISIYDLDINRTVVTNKIFFLTKKGFKYFIGYKDNETVRPLCIMHGNMSASRKDFDETKCMNIGIFR